MAYTIASGVPGNTGLGTQRHLLYAFNTNRFWAFSLTGTDVLQAYWSVDATLWTPGPSTNLLGPHGGEGRNFTLAYLNIGGVELIWAFLSSDNTDNNTAALLRGTLVGGVLTWHNSIESLGIGHDPVSLNWSGGSVEIAYNGWIMVGSPSLGLNYQIGSADSGAQDVVTNEQSSSTIPYTLREFGSGAAGQVRSCAVLRSTLNDTPVLEPVNLLADDGSDTLTTTGIDAFRWPDLGTSTAWTGTPGNHAASGLLSVPIGKNDWGVGQEMVLTGGSHLVYRDSLSGFHHRRMGDGGAWSNGAVMPTLDTIPGSGVAVSSDGVTGNIYVAVIANDAANTVRYIRYTQSSATWGSWTVLESTPATRNFIGMMAIGQGGILTPYWTEGTGPTYSFVCKPFDTTQPPLELVPHYDAILFWPQNHLVPPTPQGLFQAGAFVPIPVPDIPTLDADSGASVSAGSADIAIVMDMGGAAGASVSAGSADIRTVMVLGGATGTSASAGSATIGTLAQLSCAGGALSQGAASFSLLAALSAAGASTSAGSAGIGVIHPLSAAGSSVSSGASILATLMLLSAAGASLTAGAAGIGLLLPLVASGASGSAGAASVGLLLPLTAAGASNSTGSAGIGTLALLGAAGDSLSTGAAPGLATLLALGASGLSLTSGSTELGRLLALLASGASISTGGASLGTLTPLVATGSSASAGSSGIGSILALAVSGASLTTGNAALTILTTYTLAANGISSSTGTAALLAQLMIAGSGASGSTGSAELATLFLLSAAGQTPSTGAARLDTFIMLSAQGACISAGSALITSAVLALTATGGSIATGAARLLMILSLSAAGGAFSNGMAALVAFLLLAASGASISSGRARIAFRQPGVFGYEPDRVRVTEGATQARTESASTRVTVPSPSVGIKVDESATTTRGGGGTTMR